MANRWTGDYDAVIELAPKGANRILAALHRKGDRSPGSPEGRHLVHSASFNLPFPDAGEQASKLKGHLQIQVSTPSVDAPATPGARVTISAEIFAWFQRVAGSDPAPEFLHGTLAITAGVRVFKCQGETFVEITLTSGVEVAFTPAAGSGASDADVALIESVVPEVLRGGFGSTRFAVGALSAGDFSVRDVAFKTLRNGPVAGLGVLLKLREGGASPSPSGVSEVFLGSGDDAAVALGREFIRAVLFDLAQGPLGDISTSGSRFIGAFGVGFTVSFQASVDSTSLEIELLAGRVRARIAGSGSLSPGGSFRFRLTQHFGLATSGGKLLLTLQGDPEFDVTEGNAFLRFVLFLIRGTITGRIRDAGAMLAVGANSELNRVIDEGVGGLLEELALPDADLRFTRAVIDPDAIIVGGRLDIGAAPPVVASFTDSFKHSPPVAVALQREFNAFQSWIPGGTIDGYRWKEVTLLGTVLEQFDERHRFVARPQPLILDAGAPSAPAAPAVAPASLSPIAGWPPAFWCVEVHGRQFAGTGTQNVSGSVCNLTIAVASVDLRADERLTVQVPDGQGGALADVDPWGSLRAHAFAGDKERRGYLLVHLVDGEESVKALRKVLAERDAGTPAVLAALVVEGRRVGLPAFLREAVELVTTLDPEKAWRKRFRLELPGTTVLVGPGGREIWRSVGRLDPDELRKMLAGLREKQPRQPRRVKVGLKVGLGTLAPDILFPCGLDGLVATHKFHGRELSIVFWTSWSEASLEELRRTAAARSGGAKGPIVLCVNDGEPPEVAERALKERGIDLKLVTDPQRAISRAYGVTCWPTVVRIDRSGRIAGARFGLEVEAHGGTPLTTAG